MAGITELKKDVGLLLDIGTHVEHYLASSKSIFDAIKDLYPIMGLVSGANLDLQKLMDEALDLDNVEQADFMAMVKSKGKDPASSDFWKYVKLGIGIASDLLVCEANIKARVMQGAV